MRESYIVIRNYLFNGVFSYLLFAIYALSISPIITHFFNYGEKNMFIAIFGFAMLIAELFALSFKLKMIRIRAGEKRIAYKKETGIDIIPTTSALVFFEFFMRLVFRIAVVMVCMSALGYIATERVMSPQGAIVIMIWFFADMIAFTYMYFKRDFYTDTPLNKKDFKAEIKADDEWEKVNSPLASSDKYFRLEFISDIILQIYALMLYTAFWKHINNYGIQMLYISDAENETAFAAAMRLFPMLIFVSMIGLMPMRIAYWIEDSLVAFTRKEKYGMWLVFFIVAIFTCSPAIIKFITLFILGLPDYGSESLPGLFAYLITIALFLILLFVQIRLSRKKKKTQHP